MRIRRITCEDCKDYEDPKDYEDYKDYEDCCHAQQNVFCCSVHWWTFRINSCWFLFRWYHALLSSASQILCVMFWIDELCHRGPGSSNPGRGSVDAYATTKHYINTCLCMVIIVSWLIRPKSVVLRVGSGLPFVTYRIFVSICMCAHGYVMPMTSCNGESWLLDYGFVHWFISQVLRGEDYCLIEIVVLRGDYLCKVLTGGTSEKFPLSIGPMNK